MISNLFGFTLPSFNCGNAKISTKDLNNQQYYEIFNRITNIALSRFKWINLPNSCNPQVLEETLFFYGKALFMMDEDLGFIHTPVNLPGPFNVYYQSIERHAYSFAYNKVYNINNSVLIKANHTMLPDWITVWTYTPKIANCLRAIDVHTETLKRPFLITCPDKTTASVRQALNKIADNEIAIVGEKIGDDKIIDVKPLTSSSNLQDMWANVKNYLNQVYSSLGVKNSFTEKRERMITTEAEGEGNAIRHSLESELEERKMACKLINKMYGLDVKVEANETNEFLYERMKAEAARVTGILGIDNSQEEIDEEEEEEEEE